MPAPLNDEFIAMWNEAIVMALHGSTARHRYEY
jgi:hypothetical protein